MIPYDDITKTADRGWTIRLLDRLATPNLPNEELDDLIAALQAVSDTRALNSVEALVCDTTRPAGIRRAASSVFRGMQYLVPDVPDAKLRLWWNEGDAILRRHALLCMDACDCPEIVLTVARDARHELHAEALGRMMFFFDLPEHEAVKIAALDHTQAWVREVAATVLLWDEPVRAEEPLIRVTADPVPAVAAEAANTLEYFPSLKTIRCLHGLLDHPDEKVRQEAQESSAAIRSCILHYLCSKNRRVAAHIRNWLRPVWDMLAFEDEELHPEADKVSPTRRTEAKEALPISHLLSLLTDRDTSPRVLADSLWNNGWPAYGEKERKRLRPVLMTHPDPLVRERATLALEAWRDISGLIDLVRDPDGAVNKSAMYRLGQLRPAPGIAELAWEHLHRPHVLGTHAIETLAAFVQHAAPEIAVQRLLWIAGDHGRREELRVASVHHLAELAATEEMEQLAGQLLEPPAVTWALHIALLNAFTDLNVPLPQIGHLREADNLYVQEVVARFGT